MASQDWADRILATLHAIGKRHRGGLSEAERAAQLFPSYVRQRKGAGTIDLRKMLSILEALDEHPARFFRRVFPGREQDYRTFVDVPKGPRPAIIEQARRRLASTRPGSIPREHLEELDALRFEDPETVIDRTIGALAFLVHADVPLGLGVWASAQRQLAQLNESTHALLEGLAIANDRKDASAQGDLLQRLSYVVADQEGYGEALAVATLATDRFARTGNIHGIGRSMVDRGAWLHHLERHDEAIAMQEQALPLLSDGDALFQVAARQVIGCSLMVLGEPEAARSWVSAAWPCALKLSKSSQVKLTWLEASIAAASGDYEESESKLREVVADFANIHYGEAAVAAVELAESQLNAGKPADAFETALTILPFITPLRRNRFVRAAEVVLVGLARRGIAGMSTQVVVELRDLLGKLKRERYSWRSLRKQA